MWQVAVLWCYVEGVITVKVAVRLTSSYNVLPIKLSADVDMVFCVPLFKVLWSCGL